MVRPFLFRTFCTVASRKSRGWRLAARRLLPPPPLPRSVVVASRTTYVQTRRANPHGAIMSLKRFVYLVSSNLRFKMPEVQRSLARYGVGVLPADAASVPTDPAAREAELRAMLSGERVDRADLGLAEADRVRVLAVLADRTRLVHHRRRDREVDYPARARHLQRVVNTCDLEATALDKKTGGIVTKTYSDSREGYLDLTRRSRAPSPGCRSSCSGDGGGGSDGEGAVKAAGRTFGWDDVFCPAGTDVTYHDLQYRIGDSPLKVSPRDHALAHWITDTLYYKNMVTTRHLRTAAPGGPGDDDYSSIDFQPEAAVRTFVSKSGFLNTPTAQRYRIPEMYSAVCDEGAFFRSARNRREKTYWLPGLNAGIPYTPKRDAVHEITYMTHDLGHFTVPDLIFDGEVSPLHTNTYVVWRMLSEAVTMTMADAVFVDSLRREGVKYDFAKRCIFPLVSDCGVDFGSAADAAEAVAEGATGAAGAIAVEDPFVDLVEKYLRCNVAYCLLGDDSGYRELMAANGVQDFSNLQAFKNKYMPFFVEDYRWTVQNHRRMASQARTFARWAESAAPLLERYHLDLPSVSDKIAAAGLRALPNADGGCAGDGNREALVWRLFDDVLETRLRRGWLRPAGAGGRGGRLPPEQQLGKAFARWVAGQMMIFARYDFLPESELYRRKIEEAMLMDQDSLAPEFRVDAYDVGGAGTGFDIERVKAVRGFLDQYLQILIDKSFITVDDFKTFRTFFPLFEPFYCYYDESLSAYPQLDDLSRRILDHPVGSSDGSNN